MLYAVIYAPMYRLCTNNLKYAKICIYAIIKPKISLITNRNFHEYEVFILFGDMSKFYAAMHLCT